MRFMNTVITNKKPFGQVKKGDIIYSITYHQATVQIHKIEVTETKLWENVGPSSIEIRFGDSSRLIVYTHRSRKDETYQFGKWIVTTTLEEAKEICKEMAETKIMEHKKAIETAKERAKKWEQFKSQLDNNIYIIK